MFCFLKRVVILIMVLVVLFCCVNSFVDLIGVSSFLKWVEVIVEEGQIIEICWVIFINLVYESGVFLFQGMLCDMIMDIVLKILNNLFNLNKGVGFIYFEEFFMLIVEEVKKWYDMGYCKLEYKWVFIIGFELFSIIEVVVDINLKSKEDVVIQKLEQESLMAYSL